MSEFLEKCDRAMRKKNSRLCVGLDPSAVLFRDNGISEKYFGKKGEIEGMKEFCFEIIEKTAQHASAFKINAQYSFPFGLKTLQELNKEIENKGCVSIYDLKLNDIGTSNESSIYWMQKAGFDAFTFSPFAGNIAEAARAAHERKMGIIVLTLMSNKGARFFMRDATIQGKKGYEWIATQIKKENCDGAVVGATNSESEIKKIRQIMGEEKVMLVPGVGAQGGKIESVLKNGGKTLINIGRSLIYDKNPEEKAKSYRNEFNGRE